jgi:hypothetical protein
MAVLWQNGICAYAKQNSSSGACVCVCVCEGVLEIVLCEMIFCNYAPHFYDGVVGGVRVKSNFV